MPVFYYAREKIFPYDGVCFSSAGKKEDNAWSVKFFPLRNFFGGKGRLS